MLRVIDTLLFFLFYYEYIYMENTNVREKYCIHRLRYH